MSATCIMGARLTFAILAGIVAILPDLARAQTAANVCDVITGELDASSESARPTSILVDADEFKCEQKDPNHLWGCTILNEQSCTKAGETVAPQEREGSRFKQKYQAMLAAVAACVTTQRYEDLSYRDWPAEKTLLMTVGRRLAPEPQQDQTQTTYIVARGKLFPSDDAQCSQTSIRVEVGSRDLFKPFLD